jgi:hypothetical protein
LVIGFREYVRMKEQGCPVDSRDGVKFTFSFYFKVTSVYRMGLGNAIPL